MELLTASETARMLRVTRQTVARMIADGRIRASRVGGQWRISKEWLERYLKEGGDAHAKRNR